MTYTVADVIKDAVTGELVTTQLNIRERRMLICNQCPRIKKSKLHENLDACKECGCLLRAKTSLAKASCPLDKWGPEA